MVCGMTNEELRHHVGRFVRLTEVAFEKPLDFADAYVGVYADLEACAYLTGDAVAIDHIEDRRQAVDEALLLLKRDEALKTERPDWYERELARLEAMYLIASLRYQIVRGGKLPEYNGGKK